MRKKVLFLPYSEDRGYEFNSVASSEGKVFNLPSGSVEQIAGSAERGFAALYNVLWAFLSIFVILSERATDDFYLFKKSFRPCVFAL